MRKDLYWRLYNWKFGSAQTKLQGDEPGEVKLLVSALAAVFSNPGWIDGNMGIIVDAALQSILPENPPEED